MTARHVTSIAALRAELDAVRARGSLVGFVPTMGYLHDGHASLIRAARAEVDARHPEGRNIVVTSIFVNPLQFAAHEDLDDYPRDLDRDTSIAAESGCDLVFVPSAEEMYPDGHPIPTTVTVDGVSQGWEGASRPTHFAGVATVVAKLFSIVGPCRAYFGEKDFQQLAVVRRMVADLSMPVDVVGCETRREPDGLAMSSRNVYLTDEERACAPVLHRALHAGAAVVLAGETDPAAVEATMARIVHESPLGELDYVGAVDAATLERPTSLSGTLRLLIAVRFGAARLIDNLGVTAPAPPASDDAVDATAAPTTKE